MTFNVFNAIKHPMESKSCFKIDIVEAIVSSQKDQIDPLGTSLIYGDSFDIVDDEAREFVLWMGSFGKNKRKYFESLGSSSSHLISSIENPPVLEEKQLLSHLRYAYPKESSTLPVIISSYLSKVEEEKLLRLLREHKEAIGWSLTIIKGIRPSMYMHRILLEDDCRPTIEA